MAAGPMRTDQALAGDLLARLRAAGTGLTETERVLLGALVDRLEREHAPGGPGPLDPLRLLRTPDALDAMTRLLARLRRAGYDHRTSDPLSRFALGHPVPSHEAERFLPGADVRAFEQVGAVERRNGRLVPAFSVFAVGKLLTVLPASRRAGGDHVYLGEDTMWLLQVVCERSPGGEVAVELGAGSGFVGAALSSRYRRVVATEIVPRSAGCARLNFVLNGLGGRAVACLSDVAAAIRPGTADLVVANPPYIPDPDGTGVAFAHGGPTGFELPARFIRQAALLLRPGGLSVTLALDHALTDGRRPLRLLARALREQGFETEVVLTPEVPPWDRVSDVVPAHHPRIAEARLAALVVRRPPRNPAPGDARAAREAMHALRRFTERGRAQAGLRVHVSLEPR